MLSLRHLSVLIVASTATLALNSCGASDDAGNVPVAPDVAADVADDAAADVAASQDVTDAVGSDPGPMDTTADSEEVELDVPTSETADSFALLDEVTGQEILADDTDVSAAPPAELSLIDNAAWDLVPVDLDPFVTEGDPAPDVCPASELTPETTPEGLWFDVSTEGCSWTTVSQPLAESVPSGAQIRITVVHWEIEAGDEDYTLAVALGSAADVVWSVEVALESEFDTLGGVVTVPDAYAPGDPIWFHVGNHGENTWSLTEIVLLP